MKDLSVSTIVAIYIIAAFSACRSDDDDWKYDPSVPIGELQEEIKDLIRPDYLQAGDRSENVAMLFFANDGSPSSYTLFKLDEGGDYALDEYGSPVADTVRKQFTTK